MSGGAAKPAGRILVIKLGALGDMALALGPFAAIRRHHPTAFISLLTTAPYAEFAEQSGFFDQVIVDPRPRWPHLAAWLALRRKLRGGRFDRVYDLQSNDRTAMYRRLVWPSRAAWIFEAGELPQHAFDRHVAMLAKAGIASVPPPDVSRFSADIGRFQLPERYVLLVPGAAAHRPAKRWPAVSYGELASIFVGRSITPVILGANGDAATGQAILTACPAAIDLTGRTSLFDIPALARGAVAAIGNDTGPMHLIAAAGCPCVVLFSGASDPAQSAPIGPKVTVLRRENLAQLSAAEVAAALDEAASSISNASSNAAALSPNKSV